MVKSLYELLNNYHKVNICSISTSSKDFLKKKRYERLKFRNIKYLHINNFLSFFEPFRYLPNPYLEKYSKKFDVCIMIVGIPIWYYAIKNFKIKKAIWFASIAKEDRKDHIAQLSFYKKLMKSVNLSFINYLEKKIDYKNTKIFCLSQYTRSLIKNKNSEILSYPIKIEDKKIYNKKNTILHVSRFGDKRKNIEMLIEVFDNIIHKKKLNYQLILIGDTPSEKLKNLIKQRKLENKIMIYPFISNDDIKNYYRSSKYFILTSNEEGLGIVLLEAMSNKCIVLSTKCGGPEDIIVNNQNGFLSDKNDVSGMVENFCKIENNITQQNFIQNNSHEHILNNHEHSIALKSLNQFFNA